MTDKKHLAEQLADGKPLSTGEDELSGRKFQQLQSIASAFQTAPVAEKPIVCLFEWRHLKVESKLGEGGFGVVYRAWDPVLKRAVALKLAHPDQGHQRDDLIVAEARRMARVRHPNVLAVHGADHDEDKTGIWFDLIDGETLAQRVERQGPLNHTECLSLALQVTDALRAIHDRSLVHGDIKPANIMIRRNGQPVVMDFGAASEQSLNRPAVGSPIAMAPELFDGQSADGPSDIYALGVLLFYALTGSYPVTASSLGELSDKHKRASSVDTQGLPRRLRSDIARCLAHDPSARPDATALLARWRRISETPVRRKQQFALGAVFSALAAAAMVSFFALRSEARNRENTEQAKDVLVEAVRSVLPDSQDEPASVKRVFEQLAKLSSERLAHFPAGQADMQVVAGAGLHDFGEFDQSLKLLEAAIELMERTTPGDRIRLAKGYLHFATTLNSTEQFDRAETAARRALDILSPLRSDEAAEHRLVAHNRLFFTMDSRGLWREALQAQRDLLAARQAVHGEDSVRTAVDHHNLASALASLGEFEGAMRHEQRAHQLLIADGDTGSVRMAYVTAALANSHINLEQFDEAAAALDQAESLFVDTVGADHQLTQRLDLFRADIMRLTGDAPGAVALLREYLSQRQDETSGNQLSMDLFGAQKDLGDSLIAMGQWSEAAAIFTRLTDNVQTYYQPIAPTLEATAAYAAFRAGELSTAPTTQLRAAHETAVEQGYDKTWGAARLTEWIAVLEGNQAAP